MPKNDWLSERMVFGVLLIAGYVIMAFALVHFVIPDKNAQLLAQILGTLGTATGVIVAAIWKTDKSSIAKDQLIGETLTTAVNANAVSAPVAPPIAEVTPAPLADPAPLAETPADPVNEKLRDE